MPDHHLRSLTALAAFGALALAGADPAAVTIASSYDVRLCLGVKGRQVAAVDCLKSEGVYWQGDEGTLQEEGQLGMVAIASPQGDDTLQARRRLDDGAAPVECLREAEGSFMLWPCAQTTSTWRWEPESLQLKIGGKCLAVESGALALVECGVLKDGVAPAEQSWVLLPRQRPQVDMLETIQLPLRASGRYVGDSTGARVKLAGVNWFGVVGASASKEDPAEVAVLLKYLGFNAVRIAFSSSTELAALDKAVQAVTAEKMLVVLCRQSDKLDFADKEGKKKWLESLAFMARRFKDNQRVVGFDLLGGPSLEEATKTVPVWGAAGLEAQGAQALDVKLADWRAAAAEGAVAVWAGNPVALVVIQGAMYGTDLHHMGDRPLSLAQDCLRTRLVYATQERRSYSALFEFYTTVKNMWNPLDYYDGLEDAVQQATFGVQAESAGAEGTAAFSGQQSYSYEQGSFEDYQGIREKAAYYLSTENKAPVWVGEFGTAEKPGGTWWNYTLRALRESDTSWFYAPLGEWKKSADGLFDPSASGSDRSAVVGWKLQELVDLQRPSPLHPQRLEAPAECAFLEAPNLAIASEPLSISEFIATTEFSGSLLWALGLLSLGVLIIVLCMCCCCRRRYGKNKDPQWLAPSTPRQMEVAEPPPKAKKSFLACCNCQRTTDGGAGAMMQSKMMSGGPGNTYRQLG